MNGLPQPFWAVMLALLGTGITIVVYVYPGDITTRQAAFQIASALVTGALGAFAGHALATNQKNPQQPGGPAEKQ